MFKKPCSACGVRPAAPNVTANKDGGTYSLGLLCSECKIAKAARKRAEKGKGESWIARMVRLLDSL